MAVDPQQFVFLENPRAWMVAAACNACRHYWRDPRRINAVAETGAISRSTMATPRGLSIRISDTLARWRWKLRTLLRRF